MAIIQRPASLDNLEEIQAFVSSRARDHFEPQRIQQVLLATEEVLVNIFSHAYTQETGGQVTVSCDTDESGRFRIRFEDQGAPFNPLEWEEPDLEASIEDRPIGGLGVFFIRQMIDTLAYERKEGKNILTFIVLPR